MNKAHSVSTPVDGRPDPDGAEAERVGRMLDRFAEMAMEQAEAMHQAMMAAIQAHDAVRAREFGLALFRHTGLPHAVDE